MASNLRVDTILPSQGTTLGIGTAGGTINFLGNSNLTTSGDVTIGGNLGVGGTITYEDVARVDATGISTFREGYHLGPLTGIALTAYKDGSIRTTGIITASNLVTSGIITASSLGGGTASNTKYLRGDGIWDTVTGTTINNNADNKVITGSGTANTLEGESNLTWDGTRLSIGGLDPTEYYADKFVFKASDEDGITIASNAGTLNANENNYIMFASTNSGAGRYDGYVRYGHQSHSFLVSVNNGGGSGKNFFFESDGDFKIDGNVVIGTAGKGIDFSAQTVGSASGVSVTSEVLDHYEEGTWTPDFRGYHHGNAAWQSWTMTTAGTRTGYYVRVGQMVSCWAKFEGFQAGSGLSYVSVMGLPYISNVSSLGFGCGGFADCFDQTDGAPLGTVSSGGYFNVLAVSPNDTHNMILNTSSNRTFLCGFNYRTTG